MARHRHCFRPVVSRPTAHSVHGPWLPALARDSITHQIVCFLFVLCVCKHGFHAAGLIWFCMRDVCSCSGLKVWKPTSPGQRHRITVDRYNLWKGKPFKPLVEGLRKSGGRNNTGRISVWHQGGGHKRLYRRVDFWRQDSADSVVKRIEYDPNRGARIALVQQVPESGMHILLYTSTPQQLGRDHLRKL